MKRVFVSLIALLCVFMTACVSNSEYRALEKRVATLEKIHGITVEEDTNIKSKGKSGKNTYSLNKKSEQEIFDEIMAVLRNEPYQGQTIDDYTKDLNSKPVKDSFGGSVYGSLQLLFQENLDEKPQKDQISYVGVSGVYQNMDGSIGINANKEGFYSYAVFYILDYDRAAKVYDLLLEELSTQHGSVHNDQNKHTEWTATGFPAQGGSGTRFLSMEKKEEYYMFSVRYNY